MPDESNGAPDQSGSSSQPSFVTADDLKTALAPVQEMMGMFKTSLEAIAAGRASDRQVATAPTPINLPSDQEILEEIQAGGISKLKQIIKGAVDEVREKELRPFQQQGLNLLASQTQQIAEMSGALPHYKRFKKEIDTVIAQLPLDQRVSIQNLKIVHDSIVGQNISTLISEASEKTVREFREKADTSLPGGTNSRATGGETKVDGVPSFEEHFGKDALKALQMTKNHNTPDQFAQKMGYKDWPEYYTKAIKEEVGA